MIPLDQICAALRLDLETAPTAFLAGLEAAAVAHLERDRGWYFGPPAERIEVLDGTGLDTLWLSEAPLPADPDASPAIAELVLEEKVDGAWVVVAADEYELDRRALFRADGWTEGRRCYRATYWQGYAPGSEPQDLREAVHLLVGHWFENREAGVVGTVTSEIRQGVSELLKAYPQRVRL